MNETRQSLLLRAQTGETEAWKDLVDLYRPLILAWLNRQGVLFAEMLARVSREMGAGNGRLKGRFPARPRSGKGGWTPIGPAVPRPALWGSRGLAAALRP
jgi:hypothetical protein